MLALCAAHVTQIFTDFGTKKSAGICFISVISVLLKIYIFFVMTVVRQKIFFADFKKIVLLPHVLNEKSQQKICIEFK